MSTSLRTRLTRSAALQVLLLGGVLVALASYRSKSADDALSEQIIDQTEELVETRLEGFFDPVTQTLRVAQHWSESGLLHTDQPKQVVALLLPVMERYGAQISSLLVADDRGREVMLLRLPGEWRLRQTRVDTWGDEVRWWRWEDDLDARMELNEDLGYDPRTRPWFTSALTCAAEHGSVDGCGPIAWTEPYAFRTTGDRGITASIAFEKDGRTQVIGFDVKLSDITEFTMGPDLEVSDNAKVFVVTNETFEDAFQVLGLPRHDMFKDPERRAEAIGTPIEDLGVPPVSHLVSYVKAYRAAHDGARLTRAFAYDSNGTRWWGGTRLFDLGPGRQLVIGVTLPDSDLTGPFEDIQYLIGAAALLSLLLALWLARRNAQALSRPIETLVRGSERIRDGDLSGGPAVASDIAEVRTLAEAQDRMRQGIGALLKVERDLDIARDIQQSTLPKSLPEIAGFDLAAASEAADETGGDTFDVIELADGGTGLLLADASGHGIGPALSVTQMRSMLRMASSLGGEFRETVEHLNAQLHADLPSGRFITAWFGIIDPGDQRLWTFSAGQAPILHYVAAEDRFDVLSADIYPLGMMPTMEVKPSEPLTLGTGDVVLVLSDGYYEARSPAGEELGTERIEALVREHRRDSAAALLAALNEQVAAFTDGAPLDDDRTAILIHRVTAGT